MPLVIVSGWPLSGKTRFAEWLRGELKSEFENIVVVNDESLGINKHHGYTDSAAEKKSRAALLAAVERQISTDRLVIADGINDIKGFRYQLYCLARACSTPHVCVHVIASESDCVSRNTEGTIYPERVLHEMLQRFEEPNGQSRWDAPLFHVHPDGSFPELSSLVASLKGTASKQPSLATRKTEVPVDYVQELERTTRSVLEAVNLNAQQNVTSFMWNGCSLKLQRKLLPAEGQRLKRQFIQMNRQTACPVEDLGRLFIEYIQKNM